MKATRSLVWLAWLVVLASLVAGGFWLPSAVWADACPEPNDGPESACVLAVDAPVFGEISAQQDLDVYRFDALAPGTVRVDLSNLPADYDLYLVDSSGEVLGSSVQESTAPERLEVALQQPGAYFVYVTVDPSRTFEPGASYLLQLGLVAPGGTLMDALPPVGATILEDALARRGVLWPARCTTRLNEKIFGSSRFVLRVTGRCDPTSGVAAVDEQVDGLSFADGEIRFQLQNLEGRNRARFQLWFRGQPGRPTRYAVAIEPTRGLAQFVKQADGKQAVIAARRDLAPILGGRDIFTLALRAQGPNFWLLLNDQLMLAASEPTFQRGTVSFYLSRQGDLDDEVEVAVALRNLQVATLAGGDPALAPFYEPPRR
jgi:hypothetical protein